MAYFIYKLIPPRSTFAMDMSDHEKKIMQEHVIYWSALCTSRTAILFGPVLDPKGVYGLGILEANNEDLVKEIAMNDPAVSSGINTFEIMPIHIGMIRREAS